MTAMDELDLWAREIPEDEPSSNYAMFLYCSANAVCSVAYACVVVLIGLVGINSHLLTLPQVSETYSSLVMIPTWLNYTVWALVLMLQLIWALSHLICKIVRRQSLPEEGSSRSITCWYMTHCAVSIVWVFLLVLDKTFGSLFASAGMLFTACQVLNLHASSSPAEYWSMEVPFQIGTAWSMFLIFDTLGIVIVAAQVEASTQYWVTLLSLALQGFSAVSTIMADSLFPLVLAFLQIGVLLELSSPSPMIVERFEAWQIHNVQVTAVAVSCLVFSLVLLRACCHYRYLHRRQKTTPDISPPTAATTMHELPR